MMTKLKPGDRVRVSAAWGAPMGEGIIGQVCCDGNPDAVFVRLDPGGPGDGWYYPLEAVEALEPLEPDAARASATPAVDSGDTAVPAREGGGMSVPGFGGVKLMMVKPVEPESVALDFVGAEDGVLTPLLTVRRRPDGTRDDHWSEHALARALAAYARLEHVSRSEAMRAALKAALGGGDAT
jgi:hypothetical protein